MIYFVQATDGGPVKIGFSDNIPARVRYLESRYGRPLAVLSTMPGKREEERKIHQRFAHLRFGRTEQFQPATELMEFIGRPLFVNATPVEQMEHEEDAIIIRCKPSYKRWLIAFAKSERSTPSCLIDKGLMLMAEKDGFDPPLDR